jgi:hypothetical protein
MAQTLRDGLTNMIRRVWHWWRFWCCGSDLPEHECETSSQVGVLVTLYLALTAAPVSALFTEHRQGVRPLALSVYIAWCLTVLALVVCINRAKKDAAGNSGVYAYDGATKMAGQLVFRFATAIVLLFALCGFFNLLPGQRQLPIAVSGCEVLQKKDFPASPVNGLELFVPLVKENFPRGTVPEAFRLDVHLSELLADEWEVWEAYIYPVTPLRVVDTDLKRAGQVPPPPETRDNSRGTLVSFDGFVESDRYRVRLILRAIIPKSVVDQADPNKKKTELDQYKDKAKDARRIILTSGGVSVSLRN